MHPKTNHLLVTFEDGVKTILHCTEDWDKVLKRFSTMAYKFETKEMTPDETWMLLKKIPSLKFRPLEDV